MFTIGQQVTVDSIHTASASAYNALHDIPTGTPVPAIVIASHGEYAYSDVQYPDRETGNPLNHHITPADAPTLAEPPALAVGALVWPADEDQRAMIAGQLFGPVEYPATVAALGGAFLAIHLANGGTSGEMFTSRFTTVNPDAEALEPSQTPESAPLTPVEPLDAWEASLADSDAVLDAVWQAADNAAMRAGACAEYEATTAHPHGHPGREGYEPDEDNERRGAGTVTFERTINRVMRVTQTVSIDVEAGEDPYEALENAWDWDDTDEETYDEQTYDGPDMEDDTRDYLPAEVADERTQPADLARAALESDTSYHTIRDAILETLQAHGAPLQKARRAGIAAQVTRMDGGEWLAPATERLDRVTITDTDAEALSDRWSGEAYRIATRILQASDPRSARIAWGTLAITLASDWEVTA